MCRLESCLLSLNEGDILLNMTKKIVNARGELCPKPLIMTKKALSGFEGELKVLIDNNTAFMNVQRFLTDNGKTFTTAVDGDEFLIFVNSDGSTEGMNEAEDYCSLPVAKSIPSSSLSDKGSKSVIAFRSDKMGEGDDALGSILIQGFCNTIKEIEPLPSALIFYNSGVKLATDGSPVLPALKELEEDGMKILVCGTCTSFFELNDSISVGIISNMYDIMDCLAKAGSMISP